MNRKILFRCAVLAATPLTWAMAPALAQDSVQDFKLKPGEPTAPSGAQGPVDADAPIRAPEPSPTPAPPPTIAVPPPTAAPTIVVPAASPAGAAPANRPSPAATAAPSQLPQAMPTATATAPAFPDLASPVPEIAPVVPVAPVERVLPPAEETPAVPAWAWLVAAAALLAAGAWFVLRSRKPKPPVRLEPAPRPQPRPQPAPEADVPSPPAKVRPAGGVELQLTPRSLNSSLFMATLQYRIELENTGAATLGPIAITGDMIAAHASLNPQEQIAAAGQELAQIHRIEGLQPGQKTELTGEIRLPHSSITPIRQGNALFFVPLVRIYALNADEGADAGSVIGGGTFVIGEPPSTPGGRLRPFRLDLGPRNYPALEQRKLVMPDAMPLDGRAMAG